MTRDEAIVIVARQILADGAEQVSWEDYPEIGENDWIAVCETADSLAERPSGEQFEDAYALLEARAGGCNG